MEVEEEEETPRNSVLRLQFNIKVIQHLKKTKYVNGSSVFVALLSYRRLHRFFPGTRFRCS